MLAALSTEVWRRSHRREDHPQLDLRSNEIGIHAGSSATSAGTIDDTVIAFNAVHDSCRTVADCGAISVYEVEHTSTNITVDNNVIGNYGKTYNRSGGGRRAHGAQTKGREPSLDAW